MARPNRPGIGVIVGVILLAGIAAVAVLAVTGGLDGLFGPTESEDNRLAPGVYANESVNLTRVFEAHQTALRNRGFSAETGVISRENRTVLVATSQQVTATPNLSTARIQQNRSAADGQNATATVFANETKTLVRLVVAGNESFQSRERVRTRTVPPLSRATITVLGQAAGNFSIESVNETRGQRHITLTATVNASETSSAPQSAVTMVVDEQGVIHSLHITSGQAGATQVIETRYRLRELGVTEVQRPSWVSEIPPNATTTETVTAGVS